MEEKDIWKKPTECKKALWKAKPWQQKCNIRHKGTEGKETSREQSQRMTKQRTKEEITHYQVRRAQERKNKIIEEELNAFFLTLIGLFTFDTRCVGFPELTPIYQRHLPTPNKPSTHSRTSGPLTFPPSVMSSSCSAGSKSSTLSLNPLSPYQPTLNSFSEFL